jgi:hypothetical protein
MTLSPEDKREAWEAAAAAPPLSPATKDRLRLILWGSAAVTASQATAASESPEAA